MKGWECWLIIMSWEVAEAIDPKEAEKLRLAGAKWLVGWLICW